MDNNIIKLGVLSSYCWIEPSFKSHCPQESLIKHADFEPISLKQIPPIKRRRLNGLSKLALHSSLNCTEQANIDAADCMTVFASQHGELSRTVSIVDSMYQDQEVSPKDFSLSVHNASLGLYSIFTGNKQIGTSIAAGANSFGYALIESFHLLQRYPDKPVLLTCFDLQVGQPFAELQQRLYPSYSLSLILTNHRQGEPGLSLSFDPLTDAQVSDMPMALAFFDFWHQQQTSETITTDDTCWKLSKNV